MSGIEDDKVRENRLRRIAARRGMHIQKSRRRDPNALDYGLYCITDIYTNGLVHQSAPWGAYALTLDEVEEELAQIARLDEGGETE